MSWVVNSSETSTSAGKRNAVIWATEFLTTEIARSASPFSASTTPVVFSTALPAMPTTTIPANACERPIYSIAGESALTNQSETKADATPPAASSASASVSETRGSAPGLARLVRAQVVDEPDPVGGEQGDRADDRDRQ